jgi:hypothetical protein
VDSSGYSSGSEATFSSRLRLHSAEPEGLAHSEAQVPGHTLSVLVQVPVPVN